MATQYEIDVQRLERVRAEIILWEDALASFASNDAIEEYWMDNGQDKTKVRRADIRASQARLDALYNQERQLSLRIEGNVTIVRPYK
jgi:hypothetical protein